MFDGQRFKDECANLAASIGQMHLCPSIATVAISPSASILLENIVAANSHLLFGVHLQDRDNGTLGSLFADSLQLGVVDMSKVE